MIFNWRLISTHYTIIRTIVLITLKLVTRVAETYRWLLYNKIIFIIPSSFVGPSLKKFSTSD